MYFYIFFNMPRGVLGKNISMWEKGKLMLKHTGASNIPKSWNSQVFVQLEVRAARSVCSISGKHQGRMPG